MGYPVVAVGAANVDIHGFTEAGLVLKDSNPGFIETCLGGVSRNISENLVRMGVDTTLISALGDDAFGGQIREGCQQMGIDLQYSVQVPGATSSTYMAIMDESGDMALALSDMRVLDQLKVEHLQERKEVLEKAQVIVADAGLTTQVMGWLVDHFPGKKIILDPVSVGKCRRMKSLTGKFYCLKMNRMEAGFLTGLSMDNRGDLEKAADRLRVMGVKKVYITLGAEGVYYSREGERGYIPASKVKVANATGAGDAFTAAAAYGELQDWSMEKTARFAMGAAAVALASRHTVSDRMSLEEIEKHMKTGEGSHE